MGHKHRSSSTVDLLARARVERAHPWMLVLDGGLVLGILMWFALRTTLASHPVPFAVFSAVLVGTIVHRVFTVMDNSST
ncbi:MAG: hypothetical protein ABIW17_00055 [Marmoricola sp.]